MADEITEAVLRDEPKDVALELKTFFKPFETQAEEWAKRSSELVIRDINDVENMQLAEEGKKMIAKIRIGVNKKHAELKEESLRKGQTLDSIKRTLLAYLEPIEKELADKANFAKIEGMRIKNELLTTRLQAIEPYRFPGDGYDAFPLGEMTPSAFDMLILGFKAKAEQTAALELENQRQKAENERIAREESERIRQENALAQMYANRVKQLSSIGMHWSAEHNGHIYRVGDPDGMVAIEDELRNMSDAAFATMLQNFTDNIKKQQREVAENARRNQLEFEAKLAREKDERERVEAKAKADRIAIEAKLKKERDAKLKLEQEQRDREQLEELERKNKIAADRKAKRAPDKVKILAYADQFQAITIPDVKDVEADNLVRAMIKKRDELLRFIHDNAKSL